jgi:orotidine-5'-phosphate decarboxylase
MSFADRLDAAVEDVGHPLVLGIDPHLDLLPKEFSAARSLQASNEERAAQVEAFSAQLIDVAVGQVAAVKLQAAFFEIHGSAGMKAFENTVARAHDHGLLVIGDVKRGDVPSTAKAYAQAYLVGDAPHVCDAITINPYLGADATQPFLDACQGTDRGVFVLVRTSNPESALFQEHGDPPLSEVVADAVSTWGNASIGECGFSSVGAVVGATHVEELARLRKRMPKTLFLLPGVGAQGASAADCKVAFPDSNHPWRGALINSSRGIAFAWQRPEHAQRSWKDAARVALGVTVAELRRALGLTPC